MKQVQSKTSQNVFSKKMNITITLFNCALLFLKGIYSVSVKVIEDKIDE